jgi:kynurenine aminotransferase
MHLKASLSGFCFSLGIMAILQAFINPGDEVLLIEPYFDIYKYNIEMTDGKLVSIPLRLTPESTNPSFNISANEWKLDVAELETKITPKTKILLFNTPHNPTGKVFSQEELVEITKVVIKYNLLVVSDEVVCL